MRTENLSIMMAAVVIATAAITVSADAAAPKSIRTLVGMLSAGQYDWTDENITEKRFAVLPQRFSTKGLRIFSIDKASSSLAVEAKMRKEGYEPATIEQLLAYGAEFPEQQREGPIVALGSSTIYAGDPSVAPPGGDRYVPYLSADGGKRFVALDWNGPGNRWGAVNRFLAAPEVRP